VLPYRFVPAQATSEQKNRHAGERDSRKPFIARRRVRAGLPAAKAGDGPDGAAVLRATSSDQAPAVRELRREPWLATSINTTRAQKTERSKNSLGMKLQENPIYSSRAVNSNTCSFSITWTSLQDCAIHLPSLCDRYIRLPPYRDRGRRHQLGNLVAARVYWAYVPRSPHSAQFAAESTVREIDVLIEAIASCPRRRLLAGVLPRIPQERRRRLGCCRWNRLDARRLRQPERGYQFGLSGGKGSASLTARIGITAVQSRSSSVARPPR